jgi:molybdopterin-guanine dinucleotide biosynthesis protein A
MSAPISLVRPVILAGGGATRYGGRPKGLERVGGVRIVDRLVQAMVDAFGTRPLLVANDAGAAEWETGLTIHPDVRPGEGALGGLLTALTLGAGQGVVVAAWDMPFVPPSLLRELAEGLGAHDAFLPASDGRRGVEPMLAAYGPASLPAIGAALDRGDRRAIAFHDAVRVGILPLERVRRHGDPALLFLNVNTPEELAHAEAAWQARASVRS